jgi:hypothetical protein
MIRSLCKTRLTRRVALLLPLSVLLLGLVPASGQAQSFTPTLHSEYQAVIGTGEVPGASAWWLGKEPGQHPISMTGVVIHNPWDMLDWQMGNWSGSATPQWQVFFQAETQDPVLGDWGGTAMYMRRFRPFGDLANLYPGTAWNEEMDRLNYPIFEPTGERVTEPLRYGDRILVEAKAPGVFYNGKNNVNTRHTNNPDFSFSIAILERDIDLTPHIPTITLADLKHPDGSFIFDADRLSGCERYQGSLVHLDNLLLDDNPSNWYLNNTVTVKQGDLTFAMQLGIDPGLGWIDPFALVEKPFSVTAILNQEAASPFNGGYSLWLTNASNLSMVPEPSALVLALLGGLASLLVPRRRRYAAS